MGCKTELRAHMAHCLGIWTRQEYKLNILVKWGYKLCSTDKERHRVCSLLKSHCKHSWWMCYELPVCFGKVLWLGRMKALFNNKWGYETFLPRHRRRSSSKATEVLCVLDSSSLAKQSHWLCSGSNQLCPPFPQLKHCWYTEASKCFCQLFLSNGAGSHTLHWKGLWFSSSAWDWVE